MVSEDYMQPKDSIVRTDSQLSAPSKMFVLSSFTGGSATSMHELKILLRISHFGRHDLFITFTTDSKLL